MKNIFVLNLCFYLLGCLTIDKRNHINELLEKKKFNQVVELLPLVDCPSYVNECGVLAVGILGYGDGKDQRLGKKYLKEAVELGSLRAKVIYALYLISGTYYEKHLGDGMRLLKETVEQGSPEGMFFLAQEYNTGENIDKDKRTALELYIKSSELGHKYSPYNAGILHYEMYGDCLVIEEYFIQSAPFLVDAKNALKASRSKEPCSSVILNPSCLECKTVKTPQL